MRQNMALGVQKVLSRQVFILSNRKPDVCSQRHTVLPESVYTHGQASSRPIITSRAIIQAEDNAYACNTDQHICSQVPRAMDAVGNFVVIASGSLEIVVMRVDVIGSMAPNGNPSAKLSAVRELSIMSMGAPIQVRILLAVIAL